MRPAESSFDAGANMLANCWGAVIGAKVVKYRTAVLLGIICELVGVLVFGPRVAIVYNGILNDWTVLKPYPGLALYALMWAEMTLVTWQFLAIWKQILVPVYLGFGICLCLLLPSPALSNAPANAATAFQCCLKLYLQLLAL